MRHGFTLIEALVALVLFEFGMLALAATSAVAARDLAEAKLRASAGSIARNRVEALRSSSCRRALTGSARPAPGVSEYFRVDTVGLRRVITDSVEYSTPRTRRGLTVFRSWRICAP